MTITTQQHAIDLMPQLRDILELPKDLDLPPLWGINFRASQGDSGWRVTAQLDARRLTDLEQWDALKAWAPGVEPELDGPVPSILTPSGHYRRAAVTVVIGEVSVEIWAHVDGLFEPPQPEKVRVTGAFADFLLGEETPTADMTIDGSDHGPEELVHFPADNGETPEMLCGYVSATAASTGEYAEVTCPGCLDAWRAGDAGIGAKAVAL